MIVNACIPARDFEGRPEDLGTHELRHDVLLEMEVLVGERCLVGGLGRRVVKQ